MGSNAMSTPQLGPFVRLEGISITQLPPGGKGSESATNSKLPEAAENPDGKNPPEASDLVNFVTNVIIEAVPFIDGAAPKSGAESSLWKMKSSGKRYPSSEAHVDLYERNVSGRELDSIRGMNKLDGSGRNDETWFCRRSCHRNAAEKGTANWDEFLRSHKEEHHQSEDAFTPTIIGAREALTWDTESIEVEDAHSGRWINITLKVVEMTHRIDPKPLKNRTFPVLQLTASLAGVEEFIAVSIPIRHFDKSPHAQSALDKSLVVAAYVAIERIRILPQVGEIEWIMGTASNAGGVLPQWLQNLAVPAQVTKDVALFLTWISSQREAIGTQSLADPPASRAVSAKPSRLPCCL